MKIDHWTISPFQVSRSIVNPGGHLEVPSTWIPLSEDALPPDYVGDGVSGWQIMESTMLCLNTKGFGVIVYRPRSVECDDLTPDVAVDLLCYRREFHRSTISGNSPVHEIFRQLLACVNKYVEPRRLVRERNTRPDIFSGIPYVLSMFVINSIGTDKFTIEQKQALLALLEPSYVDCDDDPTSHDFRSPQKIVDDVREIDVEKYFNCYVDYDVASHTSAYMSWPGVVVLNNSEDQHVRNNSTKLYLWLEIRTQLAWSMAYYSRRWCEDALSTRLVTESIATEVRFQVSPILHQAVTLRDASVYSRFRSALGGMDETSGLAGQIQAADAALEDVEQSIEFQRNNRRRNYTSIVEVALFFVAATQAVPIFFDMPVLRVERSLLTGVIFMAVLIVIALVIIKRAR